MSHRSRAQSPHGTYCSAWWLCHTVCVSLWGAHLMKMSPHPASSAGLMPGASEARARWPRHYPQTRKRVGQAAGCEAETGPRKWVGPGRRRCLASKQQTWHKANGPRTLRKSRGAGKKLKSNNAPVENSLRKGAIMSLELLAKAHISSAPK